MGDELGPPGSVVSRPVFEPCNHVFEHPTMSPELHTHSSRGPQGHHAPSQRALPIAATRIMGWRGVAVTKRLIFCEDNAGRMFRHAELALSLCCRFAPAGTKLERSDSAADLQGSPVGLDRFCWGAGCVPACELPALISPRCWLPAQTLADPAGRGTGSAKSFPRSCVLSGETRQIPWLSFKGFCLWIPQQQVTETTLGGRIDFSS